MAVDEPPRVQRGQEPGQLREGVTIIGKRPEVLRDSSGHHRGRRRPVQMEVTRRQREPGQVRADGREHGVRVLDQIVGEALERGPLGRGRASCPACLAFARDRSSDRRRFN